MKNNTDTAEGKRIEKKHCCYPETVEIVNSGNSDEIPEGYVTLKQGFEQVREHIKTIYKNAASAE